MDDHLCAGVLGAALHPWQHSGGDSHQDRQDTQKTVQPVPGQSGHCRLAGNQPFFIEFH